MSDAGGADEVAAGVHRVGTRWAGFYLVVEDRSAMLVDSGYPGYLRRLEAALRHLGLTLRSLEGVLVTHHHVDHSGTAGALHARTGLPVWVGGGDAPIVRGERPSHLPPGFYRQSWRPSMMRYLAHSVRVGGARYRPCPEVRVVERDESLDLPGGPRLLLTPGHTAGHYSVVLERSRALCTGDALVSFDYASGGRRLGLHRFNEDRGGAAAALTALEGLAVEVVLFGHGDPWYGSAAEAVGLARVHGCPAAA